MTGTRLSGEFIGTLGERLFVLEHAPMREHAAFALLVAPFGDEMNKSRRMLSLVAAGLAARGITAVLPDLYGTGDSEGEFARATPSRWVADLQCILREQRARGRRLVGVLGVRLGCVLVARAIRGDGARTERTVFWQPVADGNRFMTQLLRVRVAASMMGARKETVQELRARLASHEVIDVGGYELSPAMVAQTDQLALVDEFDPALGTLDWFEISQGEHELPPASQRCLERARERGLPVAARSIAGEPFWGSTEIVVNEALVADTVARMAGAA